MGVSSPGSIAKGSCSPSKGVCGRWGGRGLACKKSDVAVAPDVRFANASAFVRLHPSQSYKWLSSDFQTLTLSGTCSSS